MIYQLESGLCMIISLDAYLELPDSAFTETKLLSIGFEITDAFYNSYIHSASANEEILDFYAEKDYIDNSESLLDASFEEKINDPEFFNKDELT